MLNAENKEFLQGLEKRLHSANTVNSGVWRGSKYDVFTNEEITPEELDRIVDIIKEEKLVLQYIGSRAGGIYSGSKCYVIISDTLPDGTTIPFGKIVEMNMFEHTLVFTPRQLPSEDSQAVLQEYLKSEQNINAHKYFGIDLPK